MATERDLAVRRATRYDLALPLRLSVADPDQAQVNFGKGIPHRNGWVSADLVDLSRGGLGILTPVFVPRKTALRVRLLQNAEPDAPVMLDCGLRVQGVVMTDRRPAYMLGTSFSPASDDERSAIEAFVAQVEGFAADGGLG